MPDIPNSYQNYHDELNKSRFTYRDLRHLAQSSVSSPLRVIALVDFDCFYAQCESVRLGLPPEQPLGVQQFLHVIATNYPARAAGLKKVMTAEEAKRKCPNIVLQHVPTWREGDKTWAYRDDVRDHMSSDKSSLDYYRLQSRRAMEIVKKTLPGGDLQRIEKAGIDEVFLDLSAQVHTVLLERYPELNAPSDCSLDDNLPSLPTEILEWCADKVVGTEEAEEDQRIPDWNDVALNLGSEIVRMLREEIYAQLKYTCSAGIARNKVLAKLAAGHNKPNKQTIVRDSCITTFLSTYKFTKLRGLGGKLGAKTVKSFSTEMVSDLLQVPLTKMQAVLGSESGTWVYRVIRGVEYSEVVSRTQVQSMLSAKTFTPSIEGMEQAERWLYIFAADIMGRIEDQEGRRPRTIVVHHQINGRFGPTRSKQAPIPLGAKLDTQCLLTLARNILADITRAGPAWPCLCLSIGVSDFSDANTNSQSIKSFWTPQKYLKSVDSGSDTGVAPPNDNEADDKSRKRTILDYQGSATHSDEVLLPRDRLADKRPRRDTFFKPNTAVDDALMDDETAVGGYRCPTCQKTIPADSVLEHLDWHVALDLQNQG